MWLNHVKKEGFTTVTNVAPKFKTQKTAFYVLLTYMVCQLSVFLLLLVPGLKDFLLGLISASSDQEALIILSAWWSTVSFGLAFFVSFALIQQNKLFWNVFKGEKASIGESIGWGIIGFFLVLFGQSIGAYIEMVLGIEMGSENTEAIMNVTKIAPIMILATVLFGPILEELVFRRVLFGSLIQKYNFWISSIVSAIFFAAIHMDFTHILLYTICGMIFSFLYYKTKRLLTPIIAHIGLNGFVTFVQLNADKFQQITDTLPK